MCVCVDTFVNAFCNIFENNVKQGHFSGQLQSGTKLQKPGLSPENGDLVILFYQVCSYFKESHFHPWARHLHAKFTKKKRENSVIIYSFVVPNQFQKYMSEHPPKILMKKHEGEQIMTEFSILGELFLRSGGLSL